MKDPRFPEFDAYIDGSDAIKRCGTATTWGQPVQFNPWLILPPNSTRELLQAIWPNLEAVE